MKETAVIIVNWHGEAYIRECLQSLETQTYKNFDIFFVDNNSSDKSLEIAEDFKKLRIIKNKENLGFAKGNNIAMEIALGEGYNYIALVNLDTILKKDTLYEMVKTIKKDKDIGAVQPLILFPDTNLINTSGSDLHYLGFSYCGDYKKKYSRDIKRKEITAASGAGVIYQSEALKKVGLLDEDFFMYLEDTDLSWRLLEAGYKVILEPQAILYHKYNFSKNKNKYYYIERNRLLFMFKNYDLRTLLLFLPAILIVELLMIFYSLFGGWLNLKLKSYGDVIRLWPKTIRKRKEVKGYKKEKDRSLKNHWKTYLHFEEVESPLFIPLNLFFRIYWFLVKIFI